MRIAIVTCWEPDDNYGTQIQCFALQMFLRSWGHDAYLVRYKRFNDMVSETSGIEWIKKAIQPSRVAHKLRVLWNDHIQKRETKKT